jgi:hypothetical protein
MKYRYGSKEKRLAIGAYPEVSLKNARIKRDEARDKLAKGIDPSDAKRTENLARKIGAANSFAAVAMEWFEKQKPHWSTSHVDRVLASDSHRPGSQNGGTAVLDVCIKDADGAQHRAP